MLSTDDTRGLALPQDDLVLPFRTVKSDVVGRVIRLGAVVDSVLSRHAYPEPVSHALGEALALTAMLGSALKVEAKLILQTKTDGALDLLVADFVAPGKVRGYASFDKSDAGLAEAKGRGDQGVLLGKGHMAMTIDPGSDKDRYQGIVPLEGEPLVDAAHTYFRQSEQLPTFIRLAVARHYGPATGGGQRVWAWRAGGLMIQQLPREGGKRPRCGGQRGGRRGELEPRPPPRRDGGGPRAARSNAVARAPALSAVPRGGRESDAHHRARRRMPLLARAHPGLPATLRAEELKDMREADGGITVTCEFCSRKYRFSSADIG